MIQTIWIISVSPKKEIIEVYLDKWKALERVNEINNNSPSKYVCEEYGVCE